MSHLRVRCWPGLKRNTSFSASGTSKRIDMASAVSGTAASTFSVGKSIDIPKIPDRALPRHADAGRHPGGARRRATVWNPAFAGVTREGASMTFEEVERLQTGAAAPLRLAGRRAETAELFGVGRTALRTGDLTYPGGLGRGDAVGVELRPPLLADPVGGPGRRKDSVDTDVAEAGLVERGADVRLDGDGGGAARIGRRDRHPLRRHLADYAEVDDREDGDFGIGHAFEHPPDFVRPERSRVALDRSLRNAPPLRPGGHGCISSPNTTPHP